MSANDNKRYYWLKLKKDFFKQHQIKVLKAIPNGRLYALIYLELLAESTSHNGELRYSKMLPYDINTLASVIDEDTDNVKCAIDTLIKLELVEILDDQTIYMCEIDRLIGSETGQTIRKNEAKKVKGGKNYPNNTLEYRDKSIDNRYSSSRYIEAGYSQSFIDQVDGIIQSLNLKELTATIYSKVVEIVEDDSIAKKQEYAYTLASKKGWLNENT